MKRIARQKKRRPKRAGIRSSPGRTRKPAPFPPNLKKRLERYVQEVFPGKMADRALNILGRPELEKAFGIFLGHSSPGGYLFGFLHDILWLCAEWGVKEYKVEVDSVDKKKAKNLQHLMRKFFDSEEAGDGSCHFWFRAAAAHALEKSKSGDYPVEKISDRQIMDAVQVMIDCMEDAATSPTTMKNQYRLLIYLDKKIRMQFNRPLSPATAALMVCATGKGWDSNKVETYLGRFRKKGLYDE